MPQISSQTEQAVGIEGFFDLPTYALRKLPNCSLDLYVGCSGNQKGTLLHGRSHPVDEEVLSQIESKGFGHVYVRREDFETVSTQLRELGAQAWNDQQLAVGKRFKLLLLAYSSLAEQTFRRTTCEEFVRLSLTIGEELAVLLSSELKPQELLPHTSNRYFRTSHFLNVAAYLVLFAKARGIAEQNELQQIATGGMLHEIGKLFVEHESNSSASSRSDRTESQVPRYPQLGFECLLDFATIDFRQQLMAYQQLERYDGTGCPVSIKGTEIDPWSKMLAIVDSFDELTDVSQADDSSAGSNALFQISDAACKQFDPEMVLCWISLFQQA